MSNKDLIHYLGGLLLALRIDLGKKTKLKDVEMLMDQFKEDIYELMQS